MSIDRQAFFNGARPLFGGQYKSTQASGLTAILDAWESKMPSSDLRWLAYMLATAFHETARTMQPVKEAYWLSEQWRKAHLRYYPYYGRGYVQLTWQTNYDKAGAYVGADLVTSPDLALKPDYAAEIMQVGMTEGWFRADRQGRRHSLARYFGHGVDDPVGAREIINGREWTKVGGQTVLLATVIARYHTAFVSALSAGAPAADIMLAPFEGGTEEAILETPAEHGAFSPVVVSDLPALAATVSGSPTASSPELLQLTLSLVTGYVGNTSVPAADLPALLKTVYETLGNLQAGASSTYASEVPVVEDIASEDDSDDLAREFAALQRRKPRTKHA